MNLEQHKYEQVWRHDAYRVVAPGEHHVRKFLELARPGSAASVCDFGCGTGRGAALIATSAQVSVTAVDFAANCLDAGIAGERVRFLQHDLTNPLGEKFDYGFCTDVLEHIPPESVDVVLTNVFVAARRVYLAISTVDDVMGCLIGEPLHLTVKDPFWWHDKLLSLGIRVDWSSYDDHTVCFYGSIYASVSDFIDVSSINVEHETIKANIKANLSLGLKEIVPHAVQDTLVYLLAGGPSLADFEQQIVEAAKLGVPCVTVNGTYGWLLDRGIRPAVQVMVDAREFNKRFVTPIVDTCTYLISSQCDHDILKSLPPEQTWLWHSSDAAPVKEAIDELGLNREWYPVRGGTTITTSALVLLAMLGFRKVEVFGFDSCLSNKWRLLRPDGDFEHYGHDNIRTRILEYDTEEEAKQVCHYLANDYAVTGLVPVRIHHAYPQPENDNGNTVKITVGGREFKCEPWMVIQANDFQNLVRHVFSKISDFEMVVHGDGLIAHLINHAAEAARSE